MHFGIYKSTWYCRWCGKTYKPLKDTDRDGFCGPACKQAHFRAYKLYIGWISGARRKRTKVALSRKKGPPKRKSGTRLSRNAKKSKKKRKKKPRFKRPVRIKFSLNKKRPVRIKFSQKEI